MASALAAAERGEPMPDVPVHDVSTKLISHLSHAGVSSSHGIEHLFQTVDHLVDAALTHWKPPVAPGAGGQAHHEDPHAAQQHHEDPHAAAQHHDSHGHEQHHDPHAHEQHHDPHAAQQHHDPHAQAHHEQQQHHEQHQQHHDPHGAHAGGHVDAHHQHHKVDSSGFVM